MGKHTLCQTGNDRTAWRKPLIIQPVVERRQSARELDPVAGVNLQVNPVTER